MKKPKLCVYRVPIKGYIDIVAVEGTTSAMLVEGADNDLLFGEVSGQLFGKPQQIGKVQRLADLPIGYSKESLPWSDDLSEDREIGQILG